MLLKAVNYWKLGCFLDWTSPWKTQTYFWSENLTLSEESVHFMCSFFLYFFVQHPERFWRNTCWLLSFIPRLSNSHTFGASRLWNSNPARCLKTFWRLNNQLSFFRIAFPAFFKVAADSKVLLGKSCYSAAISGSYFGLPVEIDGERTITSLSVVTAE